MVKPGVRVNLSVPQHKELSVGTLRALIRHAGMTVEDFLGRSAVELRKPPLFSGNFLSVFRVNRAILRYDRP